MKRHPQSRPPAGPRPRRGLLRDLRRPRHGRRGGEPGAGGDGAARHISGVGPEQGLHGRGRAGQHRRAVDQQERRATGGRAAGQRGSRCVSDHNIALAALRQLAAGLGVVIPASPSSQQQAEAAQIESQSGHNLNVAFAQASVIAHEQAILLFRQETVLGSNWKVKGYASAAMPTLKMHLSMAQQAASELGVSVAKMPQGAPATGSSASAGVQQLLLFGLGGAALLSGVGLLLLWARRPGTVTAAA